MKRPIALFRSLSPRAGLPTAVVGLCLVLTACEQPVPRSFADFMEDRIAMDGTIAFCNENREETLNNIECANARRAAVAIALRHERERREAFEIESERKLEALREDMAERERIVRETAVAAARAELEDYESMWRDESRVRRAEPPSDGLSFITLPSHLGREAVQ